MLVLFVPTSIVNPFPSHPSSFLIQYLLFAYWGNAAAYFIIFSKIVKNFGDIIFGQTMRFTRFLVGKLSGKLCETLKIHRKESVNFRLSGRIAVIFIKWIVFFTFPAKYDRISCTISHLRR